MAITVLNQHLSRSQPCRSWTKGSTTHDLLAFRCLPPRALATHFIRREDDGFLPVARRSERSGNLRRDGDPPMGRPWERLRCPTADGVCRPPDSGSPLSLLFRPLRPPNRHRQERSDRQPTQESRNSKYNIRMDEKDGGTRPPRTRTTRGLSETDRSRRCRGDAGSLDTAPRRHARRAVVCPHHRPRPRAASARRRPHPHRRRWPDRAVAHSR